MPALEMLPAVKMFSGTQAAADIAIAGGGIDQQAVLEVALQGVVEQDTARWRCGHTGPTRHR